MAKENTLLPNHLQPQEDLLEKRFAEFEAFLKERSQKNFDRFTHSSYFQEMEGYKEEIYDNARQELGFKFWNEGDIGTGKIITALLKAFKVKPDTPGQVNNLVNFHSITNAEKALKKDLKNHERLIHDLYKKKRQAGNLHDELSKEIRSNDALSYIFFISEKEKFLPVYGEFDNVWHELGISDFRISRYVEWERYDQYCQIIKEVKRFLKTKDPDCKLLDAHSFIYFLAVLMQESAERSVPANHEAFYEYLRKQDWNPPVYNENKNQDFYMHLWPDQGNNAALLYEPGSKNYEASPLHLKAGKVTSALRKQDFIIVPEKKDNNLFYHCKVSSWAQLYDWLQENFNSSESNEPAWEHYLKEFSGDTSVPAEFQSEHEKEVYWEGENLYATHVGIEKNRNQQLVQDAKEKYRRQNPSMPCQACGVSFLETYGKLGEGYIEAHHIQPVSKTNGVYAITIDELAMLCSNCHKMIHRVEKKKALTVEDLRQLIQAQRNGIDATEE